MFRRSQLRREATQLRGRIDRRTGRVRKCIDSRIDQARTLARNPAALPVAFVGGILAGRLDLPGTQRAYRLLIGLMDPAKALQIVASFIAAPNR